MGQAWRRRIGEWSARYWWAGTLFGLVMLVLGIPSNVNDIKTWAHWMTQPFWLRWLRWFPSNWIQEQGIWWAFMLTGLTIILVSNLPRLLAGVAKSDWASRLGLVVTASRRTLAVATSNMQGDPVSLLEEEDMDGDLEAHQEPPLEPVEAEEPEVPKPFSRQGYEDRFGVLWKVNYQKRIYSGVFASLNSVINAPPKVRIEGPYCRNDGTLLRYKDTLGNRYLMDEDDVSASSGALYCSECRAETRPDPGYRGKRPLFVYREVLRKEFQDMFRRTDD